MSEKTEPYVMSPLGPNTYFDHLIEQAKRNAAEIGDEQAGRKFDGEKPAMDLMPPLMELEVAKVLTFGAQKYDAENWRHVPDLHARYRSAAKRHINALKRGEQFDEESGLHHAAHAVCCLMFLGEIDLEQKDGAA